MTASGIELSELRRHASIGRPRRPASADSPRGLPQLYASRRRRPLPDLYVTDQAEARRGGGFRWFFSTCLAASVGAVAIVAVIFGSMELQSSTGREMALPPVQRPRPVKAAGTRSPSGIAWAAPKTDRLEATMDAVSTRYTVQDTIRERRASREYIHHKPYARVVIRLTAVEADPSISVPAFNPLRLFGNAPAPRGGGETTSAASIPEGGEVGLRVVELLGSALPIEDAQEMDPAEILELVNRLLASDSDRVQIRPAFAPEGLDLTRRDGQSALAAFTTVLTKTQAEQDEFSDEADGQRVKVKLARGETLSRLLVRMGAEAWLARDMVEAAKGIHPEQSVAPGSEVELTLVPSLAGNGKNEPSRYTVLGPTGEHRVTVERNAAGEFVASATPLRAIEVADGGRESGKNLSLYSSLYYGALAQGISPDVVQAILRTHAHEIDFRRRARGSDTVELFFDVREEDKGADGALGELLMTSVTIGGNTQKFYRFREADGSHDYYDTNGNNSRRFLLRKPLRSDDVRLTSGFGVRFHPLLNQRRMHSGVDWAGPVGTPIIAAGSGTVEEAGHKGQYGNYVRLRHANSYQTTYGHMRAIAPGLSPGGRVRQGQVIGYLGSTGLSSGPHLHFEVLIGNRWVDPLSIQVPREKRLQGKQLASFQRERVRVDDLMRQPPVRVTSLDQRR